MRETYTLASKFFAMVHLGHVPLIRTMGLCTNVKIFMKGHDIPENEQRVIQMNMFNCFTQQGLHREYPIEGSAFLYDVCSNKYNGNYGEARRKLAYLLAIHFKGMADEG